MNNDNIKYRLKFEKIMRLKFIGHLDLLDLFQRAVNRAGLPIAYSQGFNPHQLMSFALPLTLGFEGRGEYIDIELTEESNPEIIKENLNKAFPEGLSILSVRKLEKGEKSGASLTEAALYDVIMPEDFKLTPKDIDGFLGLKEIKIMKKGKKKTVEEDIRPDIFELKLFDEERQRHRMLISQGSMRNVKPEAVITEICKLAGREFIVYKYKFIRLELLKKTDSGFEAL